MYINIINVQICSIFHTNRFIYFFKFPLYEPYAMKFLTLRVNENGEAILTLQGGITNAAVAGKFHHIIFHH